MKEVLDMSQEKVNRYKQEKANRKEALAKEKRNAMIAKAVGGVVALALVCWIGYSVYDMTNKPDTTPIEVDSTALDEYLNAMETAE